MISPFLSLALLSNFYTANVIAQNAQSTTLYLEVGPNSTPMPAVAGQGQAGIMEAGSASASGSISVGLGTGTGMRMGEGKGMEMGMGSESSSNSTAKGQRPPSGAVAPLDVATDIPTPAVIQNPTFTTPVVVQTGNNVPKAAENGKSPTASLPAGMAGMSGESGMSKPGMSGMSGESGTTAGAGRNISQAEAAGSNPAAASMASWSHSIIDQYSAIIAAVLSGFLLCLL
ncbi:hypothetical protein OnM2_045007 [Erysiphe neolycopersici]|uniref:Uncharacterized protein n=1 Tax=Erysiphe neolycopersici TaxID=212602 RepID=A0A420HUG9_9PEZI|nr:hypothetical protein OnM2_045007 [Erysiphe neolycopersici]